MLHRIDVDSLGVRGTAMAKAVEGCVHCGFCLPVCPTYQELGEEMDSPRGRILLMKEVLEGGLDVDEAAPYVDRCLGCLACEPACPSGVAYGQLLHPFLDLAESRRARSLAERLRRLVIHTVLPSPRLFRSALHAARRSAFVARLLPQSFAPLFDMAAGLPWPLPARGRPVPVPIDGAPLARVALLLGCAQEVLAPQINQAALRVLAGCGVEVVIPPSQACCGALAQHDGMGQRAARLARRTVEAFPADVDAVLTTAAGCSSGLREYPEVLDGSATSGERVRRFASKVKDINVFLEELGMPPVPPLPRPLRVAYQAACHLEQAQGVVAEPRRLLDRIPNLDLLELDDGGRCCGSAGTYNLEQPDLARPLGEAKARAVERARVDAVASGNIGCLVQMRRHLDLIGCPTLTYHTIELLDLAFSNGGS